MWVYIPVFEIVVVSIIGYIVYQLWLRYSKEAKPWRDARARKKAGIELELDWTFQDHDPDPEFTKECKRKEEENRKEFRERTKHLRKPKTQNNQSGHNYCGRFK